MNWNGAQCIAAASYSFMYTRSSSRSLLIMMGLAWPLDLVQVALVLSLYIAYTTLSLISNRFVKHCLVCWSKNKKINTVWYVISNHRFQYLNTENCGYKKRSRNVFVFFVCCFIVSSWFQYQAKVSLLLSFPHFFFSLLLYITSLQYSQY